MPRHIQARPAESQERSSLNACTWEIFGLQRESPIMLNPWLQSYKGELWIVASSTEPQALRFAGEIVSRACATDQKIYDRVESRPVTVVRVELC